MTNTDSDSVTVLSTVSRQVLATICVPSEPPGVVVPSAGGVAYVTTRSGTVVAVSLASHRLLGALHLPGGTPGTMDYDAVTGQISVPDTAGNVVWTFTAGRALE